MQGVNCSLIPLDINGPTSPFAVNVLIENEIISLLVIKQGDDWLAYQNACPHQGRRLDYGPDMFLLKNDTLICPAHGAVFTLRDGRCIQGPCQGGALHAYRCDVVP